jgi:carboxymethylenebutenolidase
MEIVTESVRIPLAGAGEMGGTLARPKEAGSRPAVLVFMEIFGINSHIRDVTERVAREGYVALAPDYFHRTGPGVEYGYDEKGMAEGM